MPSSTADHQAHHDLRIAAIAERQLGLIRREQLRAIGLSEGAIQRRTSSGHLAVVHASVLRIGGAPMTTDQRLLAACLAGGDGSAVSHRAAAQSWDLWGGEAPIEISVLRERCPRLAGVVTHRSRDLHPLHVQVRRGIPVTDPVRTLVDLGQVVSWQSVRSVLDRALAKKLVTAPQVEAGLAMHSRRGRRGIGALRRAAAAQGLLDHPDPSVLARTFARVCADAGLPVPQVEHGVVLDGRQRWIDFAYPDLRLAVEIDGYEFHGGPDAFEADRIRGNELALHGWTVLHFTWQQVVHRPDHPFWASIASEDGAIGAQFVGWVRGQRNSRPS